MIYSLFTERRFPSIGSNQHCFCCRLPHFSLTWIHRSVWASIGSTEQNKCLHFSFQETTLMRFVFSLWGSIKLRGDKGILRACLGLAMMERTCSDKCGCATSQEENKHILAPDEEEEDLKISLWCRITCMFGSASWLKHNQVKIPSFQNRHFSLFFLFFLSGRSNDFLTFSSRLNYLHQSLCYDPWWEQKLYLR